MASSISHRYRSYSRSVGRWRRRTRAPCPCAGVAGRPGADLHPGVRRVPARASCPCPTPSRGTASSARSPCPPGRGRGTGARRAAGDTGARPRPGCAPASAAAGRSAMARMRSTAIACTGGSMIPLVAGADVASSLCCAQLPLGRPRPVAVGGDAGRRRCAAAGRCATARRRASRAQAGRAAGRRVARPIALNAASQLH